MASGLDSRGCFRDDLCLSFSVLAFELTRKPLALIAKLAGEKRKAMRPKANREFKATRTASAQRLLDALQSAWRTKQKLGFSELCARAKCARASHTHDLLRALCHQGLVLHEGSGRAAVYWAEVKRA